MKKILLLMELIVGVSLIGHAGTSSWTAGGADQKWSTAANWSGPNTPPATTDDAEFTLTGARTVNIDGQQEIENISISGSGTWTFSGDDLQINDTVLFNGSGKVTLNAGLSGVAFVDVQKGEVNFSGVKSYSGGTRISGSATSSSQGGWLSFNEDQALGTGKLELLGGCINNLLGTTKSLDNEIEMGGTVRFGWASSSSSRAMRFNGDVTLSDNLTAIVHSDSNGARTPFFYGNITDNGNGYKITIKSQSVNTAGKFVLVGTNVFSGGVEVQDVSTLIIGYEKALGTGAVVLNNGTGFHTLESSKTVGVTNRVGVYGAVNTSSSDARNGVLQLNGPVILHGPATFKVYRDGNGSRTLSLQGTVTDNGSGYSVTKELAGELYIGAVCSYTGGFFANNGLTVVQHATALGQSVVGVTAPTANDERIRLALDFTLDNTLLGQGRINTQTYTLTSTGTISPGDDSGTPIGTLRIDRLAFGTSSEGAKYKWQFDENSSDLINCPTSLTFGSAPKVVEVEWLGDDDPEFKEYTLFTYSGTNPAFNASEWSVEGKGLGGTVSLDTSNKKVVLTLKPSSKGTLLIIK